VNDIEIGTQCVDMIPAGNPEADVQNAIQKAIELTRKDERIHRTKDKKWKGLEKGDCKEEGKAGDKVNYLALPPKLRRADSQARKGGAWK